MCCNVIEVGRNYILSEARWCRTCARRNICKIKETVVMEQRSINPYSVKYLKVTIKCRRYVKNGKLSSDSRGFINSMFLR